MPWPQSEAPCLHLERARGHEGDSETAWCDDYWQGECLGWGWRWRELKDATKPPASRNIQKWRQKRANSHNFCLKITENAVFHTKVLYKIFS
jgi:hypothetical protein